MLFVNGIFDSINAELNDIFILNELKLFLILYVDDQVVFAMSSESLKSLLNEHRKQLPPVRFKINTVNT